MTSYLSLYMAHWARLMERPSSGKRTFKLFRFGLLPHEIAELNDR